MFTIGRFGRPPAFEQGLAFIPYHILRKIIGIRPYSIFHRFPGAIVNAALKFGPLISHKEISINKSSAIPPDGGQHLSMVDPDLVISRLAGYFVICSVLVARNVQVNVSSRRAVAHHPFQEPLFVYFAGIPVATSSA